MKLLRPLAVPAGLFAISFGALAQLPEKAAGTDVYTSLKNITDLAPADADLKLGGKWNVVGLEKTSAALNAPATGHAIKLRLKVLRLEPFKNDGWAYRIATPDERITIRGVSITSRVWAYLPADQEEALSRARAGLSITVSGTVGKAEIYMVDGKPLFEVDIRNARVEK